MELGNSEQEEVGIGQDKNFEFKYEQKTLEDFASKEVT